MSIQELWRNIVCKNLANIASILGVLPICILFGEQGYQYLLPLIVYNNVMDDLDGVLAAKLDIRSNFGALLDNVCDAIPHTVFVMVVGMHYVQKTGFHETGIQETVHSTIGCVCLMSSLLATVAIILRVVTRINPTSVTGMGSPTNELIRHIFLILLLAQNYDFDPTSYLIVTFIVHTVSMLAPVKMPYMIRSLTKSATAIGMVNIALLMAWLLPYVAPVVAALFAISYFASFLAGGFLWLQEENVSP